jgi:hypothetical protein
MQIPKSEAGNWWDRICITCSSSNIPPFCPAIRIKNVIQMIHGVRIIGFEANGKIILLRVLVIDGAWWGEAGPI